MKSSLQVLRLRKRRCNHQHTFLCPSSSVVSPGSRVDRALVSSVIVLSVRPQLCLTRVPSTTVSSIPHTLSHNDVQPTACYTSLVKRTIPHKIRSVVSANTIDITLINLNSFLPHVADGMLIVLPRPLHTGMSVVCSVFNDRSVVEAFCVLNAFSLSFQCLPKYN